MHRREPRDALLRPADRSRLQAQALALTLALALAITLPLTLTSALRLHLEPYLGHCESNEAESALLCDALASWGLVPQESEGEAPPTPARPGGERGAELFFFPSPPRGAELGAEAQVVMPVMPGAPLHCHQGGSVPPGS